MAVPSSSVWSSGWRAHRSALASDSISSMIFSGTGRVKNQYRTEPYSIDCNKMLRPTRDKRATPCQCDTRVLTSRYLVIHHSSTSKSFPTGTPRARIVSPSGVYASFATTPFGARAGLRRRLPSKSASRFVLFSRIAVARHQMRSVTSKWGTSERRAMRVPSSANWEILCWRPPMVTPFIFLFWFMSLARGSAIIRKSRGEMGHPCATPDPSANFLPRYPFTCICRLGGWSFEYASLM